MKKKREKSWHFFSRPMTQKCWVLAAVASYGSSFHSLAVLGSFLSIIQFFQIFLENLSCFKNLFFSPIAGTHSSFFIGGKENCIVCKPFFQPSYHCFDWPLLALFCSLKVLGCTFVSDFALMLSLHAILNCCSQSRSRGPVGWRVERQPSCFWRLWWCQHMLHVFFTKLSGEEPCSIINSVCFLYKPSGEQPYNVINSVCFLHKSVFTKASGEQLLFLKSIKSLTVL